MSRVSASLGRCQRSVGGAVVQHQTLVVFPLLELQQHQHVRDNCSGHLGNKYDSRYDYNYSLSLYTHTLNSIVLFIGKKSLADIYFVFSICCSFSKSSSS